MKCWITELHTFSNVPYVPDFDCPHALECERRSDDCIAGIYGGYIDYKNLHIDRLGTEKFLDYLTNNCQNPLKQEMKQRIRNIFFSDVKFATSPSSGILYILKRERLGDNDVLGFCKRIQAD